MQKSFCTIPSLLFISDRLVDDGGACLGLPDGRSLASCAATHRDTVQVRASERQICNDLFLIRCRVFEASVRWPLDQRRQLSSCWCWRRVPMRTSRFTGSLAGWSWPGHFTNFHMKLNNITAAEALRCSLFEKKIPFRYFRCRFFSSQLPRLSRVRRREEHAT